MCFGREECVLCGLQIYLAHHFLVKQFLAAVIVELCCCLLSFGCLEACLCGVESCTIRHLVNDEEDLALLHLLAFSYAKLLQCTAHLRIHFDILAATDGRAVFLVDGNVALGYLGGLVDCTGHHSLLLFVTT